MLVVCPVRVLTGVDERVERSQSMMSKGSPAEARRLSLGRWQMEKVWEEDGNVAVQVPDDRFHNFTWEPPAPDAISRHSPEEGSTIGQRE